MKLQQYNSKQGELNQIYENLLTTSENGFIEKSFDDCLKSSQQKSQIEVHNSNHFNRNLEFSGFDININQNNVEKNKQRLQDFQLNTWEDDNLGDFQQGKNMLKQFGNYYGQVKQQQQQQMRQHVNKNNQSQKIYRNSIGFQSPSLDKTQNNECSKNKFLSSIKSAKFQKENSQNKQQQQQQSYLQTPLQFQQQQQQQQNSGSSKENNNIELSNMDIQLKNNNNKKNIKQFYASSKINNNSSVVKQNQQFQSVQKQVQYPLDVKQQIFRQLSRQKIPVFQEDINNPQNTPKAKQNQELLGVLSQKNNFQVSNNNSLTLHRIQQSEEYQKRGKQQQQGKRLNIQALNFQHQSRKIKLNFNTEKSSERYRRQNQEEEQQQEQEQQYQQDLKSQYNLFREENFQQGKLQSSPKNALRVSLDNNNKQNSHKFHRNLTKYNGGSNNFNNISIQQQKQQSQEKSQQFIPYQQQQMQSEQNNNISSKVSPMHSPVKMIRSHKRNNTTMSSLQQQQQNFSPSRKQQQQRMQQYIGVSQSNPNLQFLQSGQQQVYFSQQQSQQSQETFTPKNFQPFQPKMSPQKTQFRNSSINFNLQQQQLQQLQQQQQENSHKNQNNSGATLLQTLNQLSSQISKQDDVFKQQIVKNKKSRSMKKFSMIKNNPQFIRNFTNLQQE